VLQQSKQLVIRTAGSVGLTPLILRSAWRRHRLLIIAWHGVSLDDEHEWDPSLYVSQEHLRRRFALIRTSGCTVLPLDEAVTRLGNGTLPPRSVALTFDDGAHDFHARALPVIRDFGFPVTLYLTTHYVTHRFPVFDTMASYLLWRARGRTLALDAILPGDPIVLDDANRTAVHRALLEFAAARGLGSAAKNDLLRRVAAAVDLDYDALLRSQRLQLVTLDEAADLVRAGIDLQLHTHRHAVSFDEAQFLREIADNRAIVEALRGSPAVHFCYPSGMCRPEFAPFLRRAGIRSATTCAPNLARAADDPLALPRLVDTSLKPEAEFAAWVSGLSALLPARPHVQAQARVI
jgi:peptidoglycan/xylan/chitin deacetylase (PgdA/CDA1 family)